MWPDIFFGIASMIKVVTSFGIMQLVEKGLITLDDSMRDHICDLLPFEIFTDFHDACGKYEKLQLRQSCQFCIFCLILPC